MEFQIGSRSLNGASSCDSRYLERARVARALKALVIGVTGQGRAADMPAAAETRSRTDTSAAFAVAGPSALPASV